MMNHSAGKTPELKKNKNSKKEDRLSSLPDGVLERILCSMDAVSAVQTSLLSKRWKNLWTSLPVLNFHAAPFHTSDFFENFMDFFMSQRDDSRNVYILKFSCDDENGIIVDSVIDHVSLTASISATIQVLSIESECVVTKLPQLSVCSSLTALKLKDISSEMRTSAFDIPSLQDLNLCNCRFEVNEVELDLFKGCANLKTLFLNHCQFYGKIDEFKISLPHLLHLRVWRMRVDERFAPDCTIELLTPKLISFSYWDSELYDFYIEESLSFLEKLDICMDFLPDGGSFPHELIELFEEMGNAKFVSLSREIIQVLSMFPDELSDLSSPFTGVKRFELTPKMLSSTYVPPTNVLTYLFGKSPPEFGSAG